jgi:cytochrome P450
MPTLRLLDAPHHPDPYPYYAAMRAAHPSGLHHDADHRLWVVSSAAAVDEVLRHPSLRVRPPAEPVPRPLIDTPAGQLFGGLMRQNDGPAHQRGKVWVMQLLNREWPIEATARTVATRTTPLQHPLNTLMFEAPVAVLWHLLHPDTPTPAGLPRLVRDVLAAWSPAGDDAARHAGSEAARILLDRLEGDANRVGLFTQTCEASAGLIGMVLVTLQREAGLRARWLADPSLDDALALEVARHDPPVQNTRRFAGEPCTVRGQALHTGEALLVLLASANRDSTATPDADRFVLQRPSPANFTWGHGAHACPGALLSRRIAMGLVRAWHDNGSPMEALTARWHFRPSPNGRLAQFDTEGASA